MQISRLFEIVYLLLNKKSMTSTELAEHFEVSRRTILRDIDTLTESSIPIYTSQGKGGGISILDSYVLNKAVISDDEQNQILFALQSMKAANNSDQGEVLSKLSALFQKSHVDWLEVDFSRWGQGSGDNARFHLLKGAILGCNAIEFEYVSSSGETSKRKVFPLKLVFKSKSWYLQGFCADRQDYRTFKLNRMLRVKETNESFCVGKYLPPPIEDAPSAINSLISLELVFPPHVAYRVYDEFDEGSIEVTENGFLHVFACLPEDNWLYGFLMSFGKDVEVLIPPHIKEHLKKYNII